MSSRGKKGARKRRVEFFFFSTDAQEKDRNKSSYFFVSSRVSIGVNSHKSFFLFSALLLGICSPSSAAVAFILFPPLISTVFFFVLLYDAQQLSLSDPIDAKIADISLVLPSR